MPRVMQRILIFATLLTLLVSCQQRRDATLVAAAISMRHALLDLGEAYEEHHPRAAVRFHFASSGVLVQQAAQGAPFDVLILAGEEEMNRLAAAGHIEPATRRVVATNRLILAVPRGGRRPARLEDLRETSFQRIALGSPGLVPAGRYAAQALRRSGLWDTLQPRLLFSLDAAQTVEYLQRDEVDAAFLYRSDAVEFPWLDVALELDPDLHAPIRYEAVLVRDAPDPAGGREFLKLLQDSLAEVVLRNHGFAPAAP